MSPPRLIPEPRDRSGHRPELLRLLGRELAAGLPFARFMELALHHPEHGYYSTRAAQGPDGDYLTSPLVHPIFGWAVAAQLEELWAALGRPARFAVHEWGAGDGSLAAQVMARADGGFGDALRCLLVERSARARERQAATCEPWLERGTLTIAASPGLAGAETGCVLSNELFDSLPVHLVRREGEQLEEAFVVADGEGLRLDWRAPADPALAARLASLGLALAPGQRAEVCLEAPALLERMLAPFARGYCLTFDYGYAAAELYAPWRKHGTLTTFYRHTAGSDPLARAGRQDITAHVDFTSLALAGRAAGWAVAGFTTQSAFLVSLGAAAAPGRLMEERPGALEEALALRRAVQALTDPAGLGRIRVLLLTREAPAGPYSGFSESEDLGLPAGD